MFTVLYILMYFAIQHYVLFAMKYCNLNCYLYMLHGNIERNASVFKKLLKCNFYEMCSYINFIRHL